MSIRPTFSGIYTARSGITASQYNIDITNQNLTNVLTTGYTRQRTDLMSVGDNGYKSKYADANGIYIGQGVQVTGTSQLRDPGYDIRYRLENTEYGYHETRLSGLEDMERIFDEIMKGTGIHTLFTDSEQGLQNALQDLSTDPNNEDLLSVVKGKFSQIIDHLREDAKSIDSVNEQQITDFGITVDKVNTALTKIAELNKLIAADAQFGNPAHELKDQRNLLLDELSGYIDMDYSYDKNGKLSVNLKTESGEKLPLIQGDKAVTLELHAKADDKSDEMHILVKAADGMVDQNGNKLEDKIVDGGDVTGGSMGAYFDLINGDGSFGTDINNRGVAYYDKMLDTFAQNFAQKVNDMNRGKLALNADGQLIIPSYSDNKGFQDTVVTDKNAALLYDGAGNIIYQLDVDNNPILDDEGNPVPMLAEAFNRLDTDKKEKLLEDGIYLKDKTYDLLASDDGGEITANNITISQGWKDNDSQFQVALGPDKISEDSTAANNNVLRLLSIMQSTTVGFEYDGKNMYTGSWSTFFSNVQTTLGGDVNTTKLLSKSYSVNVDALEDRRMSISGVDENEETANLIMYQKAFQASSRVMTAIDEMLDKLINSTGTVGR